MYVDDLCSNESIEEVIPYLLSLLPVSDIPRTRISNRMVEGLRQDSDSIHAFIKKKCVVDSQYSYLRIRLYEGLYPILY